MKHLFITNTGIFLKQVVKGCTFLMLQKEQQNAEYGPPPQSPPSDNYGAPPSSPGGPY